MSARDDRFDLPGQRVEEDAEIIDEVPLPAPPAPSDVPVPEPEPIDADDPLLNEPLGDIVPNDPITERIPDRTVEESPQDPAATGKRTEQPASSQTTPEVPRTPDWEPQNTQ